MRWARTAKRSCTEWVSHPQLQEAAAGGERDRQLEQDPIQPSLKLGYKLTASSSCVLSYAAHQDDISNVQFEWPAEEIRPREYPELEAPRNFVMPLLDGAPLHT